MRSIVALSLLITMPASAGSVLLQFEEADLQGGTVGDYFLDQGITFSGTLFNEIDYNESPFTDAVVRDLAGIWGSDVDSEAVATGSGLASATIGFEAFGTDALAEVSFSVARIITQEITVVARGFQSGQLFSHTFAASGDGSMEDHRTVEEFEVDVLDGDVWRELARGTTIGFRRLIRLDGACRTSGLRYRITKSRGTPRVASLSLHRRPPLLRAPQIQRDRTGSVELSAPGLEVRYTTDGSPVTEASKRYSAPFALPQGGTVRARSFPPSDRPSAAVGPAAEASRTFGLARAGWGVFDCSSEQADKGEAAGTHPSFIVHTSFVRHIVCR